MFRGRFFEPKMGRQRLICSYNGVVPSSFTTSDLFHSPYVPISLKNVSTFFILKFFHYELEKKKKPTIFECSNVWIKLNCCLPVPSYAGLSSWCFKMFLSVYWWKGSEQNGFMSNLLWQFLHALLCLWNLQPIIKYKTDPLQSNCMKDYFNWD